MKKYGFYGGCFNPPTKAHLKLAKQALKKFDLDKVFFVPVGDTYKKRDLATENDRFNMLKILINKNKKLEVLDIELNKKINFKAIEIFKIIQNEYDKSENYFIMGADNFINIKSWKNYEDLINNFNYIILPRNNINIDNLKCSNIKILNTIEIECSSSDVRKYIKENNNKKLSQYMQKEVVKYIKNRNLYIQNNKNINKLLEKK